MKIKYKVMILFIFSIFISVIVFLLTAYVLLNKGYWSGITPEDIDSATRKIISEMNQNNDSVAQAEEILGKALQQHEAIQFSIRLDNGKCIGADSHIASTEQLVMALSHNTQYNAQQWVSAYPITIEGEPGYLIATVNKAAFKTITYYFNGPKAKGVLGKITLLGLLMTLLISSLFMYFFSRRLMQRMKSIDKAIDEFELGNLSIRIDNQKRDELGKLASSFNGMAERIQQQVKEQEEYEEKRKQLISNLSHDLRTPLSSIVGYSEMLLDKQNEEHKYIDIIHKKAVYMEKILSQLLDFSRLEAGGFKVSLQRGDIVECIREILVEYIPLMDEQQIESIIELPDQPIEVDFDQDKMERVIRNLLDNAFKYGMENKKLRIAVNRIEQKIKIVIQDFGAGMEPNVLNHIFDRFYRANKGRATKSGGIGIGLSIVQEIIKQHKGTIEVTSTPKKGTKVEIILYVD